MRQLRLLDLFSGAGGAAKGYQRAGFYVVGIDHKPMPRYCGDEFYQADALEYLEEHDHKYDVIHSSPPCQFATKARRIWREREYENLIPATRELLKQTGKPYIIENVMGAAAWLEDPIMLNGAMFGMLVHRDRLFECSFFVPHMLLPQGLRPVKMGRPVKDGDVIQPVGNFSGVAYAREQMQIDWMNRTELAQAIPPAFTEFLGRQLLAILEPSA